MAIASLVVSIFEKRDNENGSLCLCSIVTWRNTKGMDSRIPSQANTTITSQRIHKLKKQPVGELLQRNVWWNWQNSYGWTFQGRKVFCVSRYLYLFQVLRTKKWEEDLKQFDRLTRADASVLMPEVFQENLRATITPVTPNENFGKYDDNINGLMHSQPSYNTLTKAKTAHIKSLTGGKGSCYGISKLDGSAETTSKRTYTERFEMMLPEQLIFRGSMYKRTDAAKKIVRFQCGVLVKISIWGSVLRIINISVCCTLELISLYN